MPVPTFMLRKGGRRCISDHMPCAVSPYHSILRCLPTMLLTHHLPPRLPPTWAYVTLASLLGGRTQLDNTCWVTLPQRATATPTNGGAVTGRRTGTTCWAAIKRWQT